MHQIILVPLDGSRVAESILPCVAGLARDHGARVTLPGVVQAPSGESRQPTIQRLGSLGERLDGRLKRYLQEAAIFLALRGVEAEPVVVVGDVPEQILADYA